VSYPGYELVDVTLLEDQAMRDFFIFGYNAQDGLVNIDVGFESGNCCIADGAGSYLLFGMDPQNDYLYPANAEEDICSPETGYLDEKYYFYRYGDEKIFLPPLSVDFFETNDVDSYAECSDNDNPGFFVKRLLPADD
jgi:hypothetical protein